MDLKIGDQVVPVSDTFKQLSREEQEEVIERIIADKGIKAADPDTTVEDVGRGIGTGTIVGGLMGATGAGVAGLINDAVQYPTQYGYRAVDAVLGTDLAKRHEASTGGYMGTTRALTENAEKLASRIVEPPVSKGGKLAQAITSGGVEALGGSGLFRVGGRIFSTYDDALKFAEQAGVNPAVAATIKEMGQAPVAQAAYSAAAGGGGEIAEQQGAPPIVGTVLGLGAAAGAHVAPSVVKAAPGVIKRGAENLVLPESAHERVAAERLAKASKDPEALDAWARSGETGELVPGSQPTLYEATDIQGVGHAQRDAFFKNTGEFAAGIEERRGAQNTARVEELRRLAGEGTPQEILTEFRRLRDDLDATTATAERQAREGAAETAQRAGTTATAEAVGEGIRGPVVAAQRAAKAAGNRLYQAIEAEGVTVGTGRLKAAIGRAWQDIAENPLSATERDIAALIGDYGRRLDFGRLQQLRSRIAARARDFTGLNDVERRRAKILKDAIDEAMDDGFARAIADDPNLFQRVADTAAAPAGGPLGMRGRRGAEKPKPTMPLSEFIARHGGLPLDAESTARDWGNVRVKGRPLAHTGGRSIDNYWRETLIEEGYLPPDYHEATGVGVARDVDDEVRRMLEDELHGGRRVDTGEATGRALDGPEKEFADARAMVADRVRREGVENPSPSALDEAARMIVEREETHPFTAYERAVTQGEQGAETAARPAVTTETLEKPYGTVTRKTAITEVGAAGGTSGGMFQAAHEGKAGQFVARRVDDIDGISGRQSRQTYVLTAENGWMSEADAAASGYTTHFATRAEAEAAAARADGGGAHPGADVPFEGGGRVEPPVDEGLTAQQREANRHWREMKQTYGAEPVKPIVAQAPTASGFKMTEAGIPEAAFRAGPKGGEAIRAMRAAGATDAALTEAAALSFADPRRGVMRDGIVDPKGFRRWLNNYGPALAELPPEVRQRFTSANDAAETLRSVTEARKAHLSEFDKSAVGKVADIPVENLTGSIRAYLENPAATNQLARQVANTSAAKAGLQRLVADHIIGRFTNASDELSKASLTNYVKDHQAQLTAVFGKDGLDRFRRVATDIERSRARDVIGKDPAGPSTAADILRATADASIMTVAASLGGAPGVAATATVRFLHRMLRQAGINSVEKLYAQALLDPEFARKILTKASALKSEKFRKGLGQTILRSSLAGAAYGGNQ